MSIDKITSDDQVSRSKDLIQENIDQLKQLFPEIVSEGKIDFKSLQQVLGDEIEDEEEFYRFTWAGKSQARREAHKPSTGTLRPDKDDSLDWDTTQNVYVEGDNLEVLKLLQKSYAGKIKMIYIDPPYNTGKDFVYKDNYKDNLKNYQEVTGQINNDGNKISTNSDSDGRFHSNWLNMMYPRLRLSRNLLKDSGIIFITIDDNEIENLKKICNECFGEENFIGSIVWNSTKSVTNTALISVSHNYNLVYCKDINFYTKNREKFRLPESGEGFSNPDNDPRGPWKADPFQVGGWRPNQQYEIINPNTGKKYLPNENCSWKNDLEKYKELVADNRIVFGTSGDAGPQRKRFLNEALDRGKVTKTWWDDLGATTNGTNTVKKLFDGNSLFTNPKPVDLIERMIQLGDSEKDGIILDFFAGSSTTAHAVMNLNSKDGGKRKFIQVQLPEDINENEIGYKLGYRKITEIGKERIRRVASKLKEENNSSDLDLGFKVFKLGSSNIKSWDGNPSNLESNLFDSISNIKDDRTEDDLLYEILLKYGLDLSIPIELKEVNQKKIYNIGLGALFICLDQEITVEISEIIGKWKEEFDPEISRVIFRDEGFNDVDKTNSFQILKRYGINEIRSI
ncbi:MAG: site-specific DNA-methyltransferase [Flavobacteriaceae bacterium]|nr:site-specific DNA-methyltransferase [Flavobacteriaceae bacterium]|tara:strand:+ start:632 stop:2500 length:1869 start_codon:yes stop_codon:yes gene_type:complete